MHKVLNNLPNNGLCPCGYPYDAEGICLNPNCPIVSAYTAGYRAPIKIEQYPIEDDAD